MAKKIKNKNTLPKLKDVFVADKENEGVIFTPSDSNGLPLVQTFETPENDS